MKTKAPYHFPSFNLCDAFQVLMRWDLGVRHFATPLSDKYIQVICSKTFHISEVYTGFI